MRGECKENQYEPRGHFMLSESMEIRYFGDSRIFDHCKTAFLCSRHYPASAILPIYDRARQMRDTGECVISGFHSALERDVLDILLYGSQPLILSTARGLPKRYPANVKKAIDDGRLLVVSPFPETVVRITSDTARKRNAFMLSVAKRIVIGHMRRDGILAETLARMVPDKEIILLSEE